MVNMEVGTVQRDKDEPVFYGWPGFSMPVEVQFFGSYFNRQYNKLVPFLSALVLGLLVYVHTCGLCVEIRVLQLDAISHRKGKIGLTRRYPIRLDPNGVGFTQPAKQMGRV